MLSSNLTATVLALSLLTAAGCVMEVSDDEALSSDEQALMDDNDQLPPDGSTTSTIYPMMSVDLTGISAERRWEDGIFAGAGTTMEVYGSIAINNVSLVRGSARNLGVFGNPTVKSAVAWGSTDGAAPKLYDTAKAPSDYTAGPQYLFKDTKLCASNSYSNCQGSWLTNNQVVQVPVRVGDTVKIDFNFLEWDPFDDDQFCHGSVSGVVAKNSAGKYILKTSANGSQITTARGTRDYTVPAGAVYGGLITIPLYEPATDYCQLFFNQI